MQDGDGSDFHRIILHTLTKQEMLRLLPGYINDIMVFDVLCAFGVSFCQVL